MTDYVVEFGRTFNWPPDVVRRQRLGDLSLFLSRKEG